MSEALWYLIHYNSSFQYLIAKYNPFGTTTRVVLLGDAMHAMTTHAGLGANTAFQDAADLAVALAAQDWKSALMKYEKDAVKRGTWVYDPLLVFVLYFVVWSGLLVGWVVN